MGNPVKLNVRTTRSALRGGRKYKPRSPIDKAKAYEVVWNQVGELFDAARVCLDVSFVYLIGEADDGAFKIGRSKDPVGRLRNMQTGNPRRLRIEYVLIGDLATEKLLHEFWEPFAIVSSRSAGKPGAAPGTEWFKPEAREQFLPIVEDAAERQLAYLHEATTEYNVRELEGLVRDAHAESGFVARGRDEVHLLARGAGTICVTRRSRI